ncbi:25484_t:CDS:2 [Gigaspora margarita]|uniref:25484_t:CDS:1 n=1 Tax=Gigaspora margarita TaxID=4874 RepID=A0ABN7ULZ5_GIGMA|nr:25484_t:CDS:2 [Gigaspora margarita]
MYEDDNNNNKIYSYYFLYTLTAADIPLEKAEKLKLFFLNKYYKVC